MDLFPAGCVGTFLVIVHHFIFVASIARWRFWTFQIGSTTLIQCFSAPRRQTRSLHYKPVWDWFTYFRLLISYKSLSYLFTCFQALLLVKNHGLLASLVRCRSWWNLIECPRGEKKLLRQTQYFASFVITKTSVNFLPMGLRRVPYKRVGATDACG